MLWGRALSLNVTNGIINIDSKELPISPMPMDGHCSVNLCLKLRIALNKTVVLYNKWVWHTRSTKFCRTLTWHFPSETNLEHAGECGITEDVHETFRHTTPPLILRSRPTNIRNEFWLPKRDRARSKLKCNTAMKSTG